MNHRIQPLFLGHLAISGAPWGVLFRGPIRLKSWPRAEDPAHFGHVGLSALDGIDYPILFENTLRIYTVYMYMCAYIYNYRCIPTYIYIYVYLHIYIYTSPQWAQNPFFWRFLYDSGCSHRGTQHSGRPAPATRVDAAGRLPGATAPDGSRSDSPL